MNGPTSARRRHIVVGAAAASTGFAWPRLARAAEFTYKYGNQVPMTHPVTVAMQAAAEAIRKDTDGRLDIRLFPNNQLGGDTDMLAQLRSGGLEFFTCSPVVLSTLVSVASINGIGFAFKDSATAWAAMDGDLGAMVRANIRKSGLIAMDKIWDGGYRQITSNGKPIRTADDLKGFKIRVPVSALWTSMFKAFGAASASINFAEVYLALQTKTVDGQETPLVSIDSAKLYEVQKYCSMTNHMWDGYWFLANGRAWDRLPKDLQDIAARNLNAAALEQRKENLRLNETLRSALEKKGLVFNVPDPSSFREALTRGGFYSEWSGRFGPDAWSLLERYAGKLA